MRKFAAILASLGLCLSFAACAEKPTPSPTEPTEPPYKTVFVHASITRESGSTISRTEFVFNEQEWVTEVVVYTNGTETKRHSVLCDENGNYTRWTSAGSTMEYSYDTEGHSLGMSMYIGGQLVSATEHTWEKGLRTSVTTTMAGQNMTQKVLMTYDSGGKLLRQDSYNADILVNYSIYAYDVQGRVASMTTYHPDGSLYSVGTHTWDGNSQTIVTTDRDGAVMQTAVLTYDEHHNILTHTVYNALGDPVTKETHTWKAIRVDPDCPRASV